MSDLPRLVVAAAHSGAGKTTVAFGLMAALRARGLTVAPFKVGPDYIDPGYHALATGRPGRNLDPWLCGEHRIVPLFVHGAADADVSLVEGVMGLLDGRIGLTDGRRGFGSTAHVARLLDAPTVLVVDAAHTARTAAAVAHGLATHPDAPRVGGVILNRTGSPRALAEVTDALAQVGLPLLGTIPRTDALVVPSRHLGLVPAAERGQAQAVVAAAARVVADHVDLDAVLAVARSAAPLAAEPWRPHVTPVPGRPRVAVAGGRAFTFRYAETTELLTAAGCEVVEFDPLTDPALPDDTAALYLGGGFPEVYAEQLAGNASLRADVAAALASGLPTYAECAGLLYLCRTLDGLPMAGALPLDARMSARLTLQYDTHTPSGDSVVARAGEPYRFHAFHRTVVDPADGEPHLGASVHASYHHVHWAGYPALAQRFAEAAAAFAARASGWVRPDAVAPLPAPDLDHHGDADLAPGLVDLAVNVREHVPPAWLLAALVADPGRWARYPDAGPARAALAARHGVPDAAVLPTAGAAEAFTLVARGLRPRRPVVVHPQFTEPEAALAASGLTVRRVHLRAADGFAWPTDASGGRPAPLVAEDADLVVVGNPTNPTGVLHPAATLRTLVRPGRAVVVDEAFADFVPGEPESLIGGDLTGIVVVRSLTKMWGVAGLRAGYVVGDPELVARLAAAQRPWAVPTPALDALVACSSPAAVADADAAARAGVDDREALVRALAEAGFPVVGEPRTPFVLVDTATLGPESVRPALAARGFAVRRGESFPGLGPSWIRVAVRDPATSRALAYALLDLRFDLHRRKHL